jgi:hypothetical protein
MKKLGIAEAFEADKMKNRERDEKSVDRYFENYLSNVNQHPDGGSKVIQRTSVTFSVKNEVLDKIKSIIEVENSRLNIFLNKILEDFVASNESGNPKGMPEGNKVEL